MNECDTIRERLDDWLDDCVGTGVGQQIDDHLQSCSDCRRIFQDQRALANDLVDLGQAADRMASAGGTLKVHRPRWRSLIRIAAAILLMLAVGDVALQFRRSNQPASKPISQRETFMEKEPSSTEGASSIESDAISPAFSLAVDDDHLALVMQSKNPRIHIVWVYHKNGSVAGSERDEATNPSDEDRL